MTLTVEDGSGVTGAESYISVADASTYHSNRGNSAWAALASDAVREQCLRKATDYMLQKYRSAWKGFRVDPAQALDWPRYDVYRESYSLGSKYSSEYLVPSTVVPDEVKNACAELALKAATADLNADLTQGVISETVGPISTTYDKHSAQYKRYRAIDMMLSIYLRGSSLCASVVRS